MSKVSVIIPTYNCPYYLCEAIDSVLAQTYKDYEIIVVDDGSTDNTQEVLQKYSSQIKYVYQKNKGVAGARNTGVISSDGVYVAFLDQDDVWKPSKLSEQVAIMEKDSDLGLVCSMMETIDSNGKSLYQIKPITPPGDTFETALLRGSPYPSTYLARRSCFDNVGYFDESIAIYDDLDLYLRIALKYKIKIVKEPTIYYRMHAFNTGKNDKRVHEMQILFARKWMHLIKSKNLLMHLLRMISHASFLLLKIYFKKNDFKSSLKSLIILLNATFAKEMIRFRLDNQ